MLILFAHCMSNKQRYVSSNTRENALMLTVGGSGKGGGGGYRERVKVGINGNMILI